MKKFQSRKRFRHCWSFVPPCFGPLLTSFNRESDSVTVGALVVLSKGSFKGAVSIAKAIPSLLEQRPCVVGENRDRFQSRKRFRHCWSPTGISTPLQIAGGFNRESDSVTVGARPGDRNRVYFEGFNRESDSVTVGATPTRYSLHLELMFQSRKRFRHCWSAWLSHKV